MNTKYSLTQLRALFRIGQTPTSWPGLGEKRHRHASMLRPMRAAVRLRDAGLFHSHRRLRGPLVRAVGPGSYGTP